MTQINRATEDLIKEFEGLSLKAYRCPADKWTIGYGITADAGVGIEPKAGMVITEADADMYFRRAINKFAAEIRPLITVPITENEFGAFVSLAYNIGSTAFAESTALRRFNDGDKAGAVEALQWFKKAGGKTLKGLVRRRAAEAALFVTPGEPVDEPISHPDPQEQPPNAIAAFLAALAEVLTSIFGGKK